MTILIKKLTFSMMIFFISSHTIGQCDCFELIDQSSIYRELGITKGISIFHDSTFSENMDMWKINSDGLIFHHTIFPDEPYEGHSEFEYVGDRLSREIHIGRWNADKARLDTFFTIYNYKEDPFLKSRYSYHTKDDDTISIVYEYNGNRLLRTVSRNHYPGSVTIDSLFYSSAGILISNLSKSYNEGVLQGQSEKYFDERGKIQVEVIYNVHQNQLTPYKLVTYIYEDHRLKRIKSISLGNSPLETFIGPEQEIKVYELVLTYDNRGLLVKCERLSNGELDNFDVFKYQ